MTAQDIIAALGLPVSCRVDQRVPKKLLIENGATNASDKRQINDGIEDIQWLAALKLNTIGVPEYRDDVREYLEIAVLSVTLKATSGITATPANHARLAELVHRAVPYPMILLLESEQILVLSLAHKRRAQNQTDKVILDGAVVTVTLTADAPSSAVEIAFLQALGLRRQPQTTLNALYKGWIGSLQALLVSRLTGTFNLAGSPEHAARCSQALHDCLRLELQTAALHAQAGKEKQLARQVELNLELMRVKAELIITRQKIMKMACMQMELT